MYWVPYLGWAQNCPQMQVVDMSFYKTNEQWQQSQQYGQLLAYCDWLQKQNQELKQEIICLKQSRQLKRVRKVKRRVQDELVKNFRCLYHNCKKQYASQLALNLHMKIKHNAGSKRDRITAINQIISARSEGRELPQLLINLPPHFLQTLDSQPNCAPPPPDPSSASGKRAQ